MEKQRLNLDLDSLFPGEELIIGNTSIMIPPLGLSKIAMIAKKLKSIGVVLTTKEITWDNFQKPEKLFDLVQIIIDNIPEILEEASNIHGDDLKALPIDIVIAIVSKVIDVNLAAKESLEGNLKSLTEKLGALLKEDPKKEQNSELERQSKS